MSEGESKYLWFDTTNNLRLAAGEKGVPLIGTFELTARCNLECKMCYIRHPAGDVQCISKEMTMREWIGLGEEAARAGTLFLLLTGGEPLLRKDFREIYESLVHMGFVLTLYTNGTLVTPEFVWWLSKIPPSKVVITLYGASPETYGKVCGSASAFEQTIRGADLLKETGIETNLRTTLIRGNVQDYDGMKQLAEERNMKLQYTMLISKPVRGNVSGVEEERLTPMEMISFGMVEAPIDFDCPPDYTESLMKKLEDSGPMFCAGGKCSYWVAWDGRMLPCALMDRPYAKPLNAGFERAWRQLKESIGDIAAPGECKSCEHRPYCSVCPGRLQAETGAFEVLSPYLCDMAGLLHKKYRHSI